MPELALICSPMPFASLYLLLMCLLTLGGCSTARPTWRNAAVHQLPAVSPYRLGAPSQHLPTEELTIVLTFSGGGTRAAAFATGVLEELADTHVTWQGRRIRLSEEVDIVSGVSGGSVAAAYFVAFGADALPRFREKFLYQDIEGQLLTSALRPDHLWQLSSPWIGISEMLVHRFDRLFRGLRYADLMTGDGRPLLLVTATDLDSGREFPFTQDRFDALCSDLGDVPLSFAVASSSAVPLLLTPTNLAHPGSDCDGGAPSGAHFLHLVDGGLSDNLGLRPLLKMSASSPRPDPGLAREVLLINVDAARDPAHSANASDRVPNLWQMIDALASTTTESRNDDTRRWLESVLARQRSGPTVTVVSLSLREFEDLGERVWLRKVPTSFSVRREDVDRIIRAGRIALRKHPQFRELVRRLEQ